MTEAVLFLDLGYQLLVEGQVESGKTDNAGS
jgi:hypothetical protein